MIYENTRNGIFIERLNRFLAKVFINNEEHFVHVKNTGRCKEILFRGQRVILQFHGDSPQRKTKYSLIGVWKEDMLINIDSQVPNSVIFDGIKANLISEIKDTTTLKKEQTFGNSRFDMYYENSHSKGFIEIKGVTLEENMISMFPDAPTIRGTKHIRELIHAKKDGYEGFIVFLVQMRGPTLFKPNSEMDSDFSNSLKEAASRGVNILVYDSIVTENSIVLGNKIPHKL